MHLRSVLCADPGTAAGQRVWRSIGLINACGALGAFLGSWIVGYLIGLTGNPGAAYIFMTAGMLAAALIMGSVVVKSFGKSLDAAVEQPV